MSGKIIDNVYYENTGFVCPFCAAPLFEMEYLFDFICLKCARTYNYECIEYQHQNILEPVSIATKVNGKFVFLFSENETVRYFENQIEAEVFLHYAGASDCEIENLYFVELDDANEQ